MDKPSKLPVLFCVAGGLACFWAAKGLAGIFSLPFDTPVRQIVRWFFYTAITWVSIRCFCRYIGREPERLRMPRPRLTRPTLFALLMPPLALSATMLFIPGKWVRNDLTGGQTVTLLLFTVFGSCLSAGINEELIFRGFLLGILEEKWGKWRSVLLSSILFAAMHYSQSATPLHNILYISFTFVFGLFTALLARHSGHIWNGALFHGCWLFYVKLFATDVGLRTGSTFYTYVMDAGFVTKIGSAGAAIYNNAVATLLVMAAAFSLFLLERRMPPDPSPASELSG